MGLPSLLMDNSSSLLPDRFGNFSIFYLYVILNGFCVETCHHGKRFCTLKVYTVIFIYVYFKYLDLYEDAASLEEQR